MIGNRNFAAIDDVYTADARVMPPGAPTITGRENIRQFWERMVQSTSATALILETLELIDAGDGALELGRAVVTVPTGQMEVKYVVYWRQEDSRWKLHVDIWNPNS